MITQDHGVKRVGFLYEITTQMHEYARSAANLLGHRNRPRYLKQCAQRLEFSLYVSEALLFQVIMMEQQDLRFPVTDAGPGIWYFAYGSNIMQSVMDSRGLTPCAVERVVVPSYILTFDVFGVPYSEPAMASIAKRSVVHEEVDQPERPAVHGVAYLLSQAQYRELIVSEGAGMAYVEVEVDATVLSSEPQRVIVTRTLAAKYPFRPNALPSARYLVSDHQIEATSWQMVTERLIQPFRVSLWKAHQSSISPCHIKST